MGVPAKQLGCLGPFTHVNLYDCLVSSDGSLFYPTISTISLGRQAVIIPFRIVVDITAHVHSHEMDKTSVVDPDPDLGGQNYPLK